MREKWNECGLNNRKRTHVNELNKTDLVITDNEWVEDRGTELHWSIRRSVIEFALRDIRIEDFGTEFLSNFLSHFYPSAKPLFHTMSGITKDYSFLPHACAVTGEGDCTSIWSTIDGCHHIMHYVVQPETPGPRMGSISLGLLGVF